MLDYGAAAQVYFSYKPYDLMNSGLTAEQRAFVDAYNPSMITPLVTVDSAKSQNFPKKGGFDTVFPTVSFEGAFAINFYVDPAHLPDGNVTMYCWSLEQFNSVTKLSKSNASGAVPMTGEGDGAYSVEIGGIAAKQVDQPVFVSFVYQSGGVNYCTGVICYSLGQYCKQTAAKESNDPNGLAARTAVYGYYAKAYFASLEK